MPPEAHNLYQVQPGNKFRVRYLESVAIDVLDPGTEANTGAVQNRGTRTKGATPGGAIVKSGKSRSKSRRSTMQTAPSCKSSPGQAGVEGGSGGQTPNRGKRGDMIRVRYTEALALEMVQP